MVRFETLEISNSFEQDHLPADTDCLKSIASDPEAEKHVDAYLKQHQTSQLGEYEYPLKLINRLNDLVYEKYGSPTKKLKFIDHHNFPVSHHPKDISESPHFYCGEEAVVKTYEELQIAAPWHYSDSLFELGLGRTHEEGLWQATEYAGMLNQSRPDKPGVYVGYMSPEGYHLIWSDPTGLDISKFYSLDDLLPLTKYIYCLYHPPAGHIPCDTTITLANPAVPMECPLWNVQFRGVTYENCAVMTVGRPWTGMTWIAVPQDQPEIVIKDAYVEDDDRMKEGDYYDLLQRDGPAPGWVHVRTWGEVKNGDEAIITPLECWRAKKIRLIMDTTGEPLHKCKTVFEFLKAMYDILESHRWAVLKRRVLHRDISPSNILVHPKGTYMPAVSEDDERPKFADEILSGTKNAPPTAILYDLDTATLLEGADVSQLYVEQEAPCRTERTGTPMYISRAVCQGTVLDYVSFSPMPPVSSEYSASYYAIHSSDPFRQFHDTTETYHGGALDMSWRTVVQSEDGPASLFRHEPRHDAESVYWVMVAFLLRARPRLLPKQRPSSDAGPHDKTPPTNDGNLRNEKVPITAAGPSNEEDPNNGRMNAIWQRFVRHSIPTVEEGVINGDDDSRDSIFYLWHKWRGCLHPGLASIAQMMGELSKQVRPEYAFIKPKVNEVHLHETMQRIIFEQLWKMKDCEHIYLNLDRLRPVLEYVNDPSRRWQDCPNHDGRGTSNKRSHDSETASRQFKRKRNT